MNKAMLVESMSAKTRLPKSTCKECLEAVIGTIGTALKQNKSIVLTGFGTFTVVKRKPRMGVNPATGAKMRIPGKKAPKFKAGKFLKGLVA